MRRPRRAAVGVLSPWRAPKLGKIRRRACLHLIPFPGTGNVLLAPTMISHPLAYVAPTTRHLAPTVGPGAPSSGDLFWTGTLFLPRERSQPAVPDGVCLDALQGVDETRISDEPASDAGTDYPENRLVSLLDQLYVVSEPVVDLESVGATAPMPVDSDMASLDTFPTHVAIYNDPLPRADGCDTITTEVMVIGHGGASGENALDARVRRSTTCPSPSRPMPQAALTAAMAFIGPPRFSPRRTRAHSPPAGSCPQ